MVSKMRLALFGPEVLGRFCLGTTCGFRHGPFPRPKTRCTFDPRSGGEARGKGSPGSDPVSRPSGPCQFGKVKALFDVFLFFFGLSLAFLVSLFFGGGGGGGRASRFKKEHSPVRAAMELDVSGSWIGPFSFKAGGYVFCLKKKQKTMLTVPSDASTNAPPTY